jgi:hypothetical protein
MSTILHCDNYRVGLVVSDVEPASVAEFLIPVGPCLWDDVRVDVDLPMTITILTTGCHICLITDWGRQLN